LKFTIFESIDEDKEENLKKFNMIRDIVVEYKKYRKRKVLIFFYYSGHGEMINNETYGVNEIKDIIPIDNWIRLLAKYPNTFTIGLLDCCRIQSISMCSNTETPPLNGQYYIIYAANENQKSMAKAKSRNSVVTGSFLEHIKKKQNQTFPTLLKDWE
jgi:hypothetical protein